MGVQFCEFAGALSFVFIELGQNFLYVVHFISSYSYLCLPVGVRFLCLEPPGGSRRRVPPATRARLISNDWVRGLTPTAQTNSAASGSDWVRQGTVLA